MLLDPFCFIQFLDKNKSDAIEYIDNWAEGQPIYHLFEDLPVLMSECIHIEVAKEYLIRLGAKELVVYLNDLDCPCNRD